MDSIQIKRKELKEWSRFIKADSHILKEYPDLIFQQAANLPDDTAPARLARLRSEAGLEKRQWIRWINKHAMKSACLMTLTDVGECTVCGFAPDGQSVYANSFNVLKIWDSSTGELIAEPNTHQDRITACAFSPNGTSFVTASLDKTLKLGIASLWTELTSLFGHRAFVHDCSFSPDGNHLVSVGGYDEIWPRASSGELLVWNAGTRKLLANVAQEGAAIKSCEFSGDGSFVLSSSAHDVKLWDALTWRLIGTCQFPEGLIIKCGFMQGRSQFFTVDDRGIFRCWDSSNCGELFSIDLRSKGISAFAISPDRTGFVFASKEREIKVWDIVAKTEISTLYGHGDVVTALAFSPDGNRILSASLDDTIRVWDIRAADAGINPTPPLRAFAFSPNGRQFIAAYDESLALGDFPSGEIKSNFYSYEAGISRCSFSPDGRHIVTASDDGNLTIYDISTDGESKTLKAHEKAIIEAAYSPDGSLIASASTDNALKLWDTATYQEQASIPYLNEEAGFAFCPDRLQIVTGGETQRHIHRETGEPRYYTEHVPDFYSIRTNKHDFGIAGGHKAKISGWASSPDSKTLVTASQDSTLIIWNLDTHEEEALLEGHIDGVESCDYSPDGARIASGGKNGLIILWDASTHTILRTFSGHRSAVLVCSFSPDSRRLLTGDEYGRINLWDVDEKDSALRYDSGVPSLFTIWNPDGLHIIAGYADGSCRYLRLENIEKKPPVVTAHYFHPNEELVYWCPNCGSGIAIEPGKLNAVLPCPHCRETAKLSPHSSVSLSARPIRYWDGSKYRTRITSERVAANPHSNIRWNLAEIIHENYRRARIERLGRVGQEDWDVPFSRLPASKREACLLESRGILKDLFKIGYLVRPPLGGDQVSPPFVRLKDSEFEALAQLNHRRWMANMLSTGWKIGPRRSIEDKQSPYLVNWCDLGEESREGARKTARNYPEIVYAAGYYLIKFSLTG